jgi:hypothetical protein
VQSSPAVVQGVVYLGSLDKNLYAIDTVTGKEKWRFATGDMVTSSPAVANGVVYVGSYDYKVYAIDAATGSKTWFFTTEGTVYSSPAVANGVVYIGTWGKSLYAIGQVQSTLITNPTDVSTPIIQSTLPSSSPSNSGDFNLSLLIIVILVVLFLAGGGYAIHRMMKKPSISQPAQRTQKLIREFKLEDPPKKSKFDEYGQINDYSDRSRK